LHVGAMFLPSLVTGFLVNKIGRATMAIASAITLLASGSLAAMGPADSMVVLITALVLLGLGWNFGLISGTAIIVDATPPSTRAKAQGSVDVLIALSGALGGGLSGIVVAHSSYAALSIAGAVLSLLLIPVIVWAGSSKSKVK
ncbi:MFS transporter, partial [Niallia sp. 01092]|uniref:MFS transporter n=1 Tax=Niallia sp. 01092 TaxID=3457759 RepID=UPI003FD4807B